MFDVFFYEAFKEEVASLKKYLPNHIKAGFTPHTIQESGHKAIPAKIISVRTQSEIPDAWVDNIGGILSRTTGYDHVEKYACKVPCGYLPQYCSRSVAEQAMLLLMSLFRKLPEQMHHFRDFNRDGLTGLECKGKNMVVVGVGNIGYEVYKIAKGLEMHLYGVDIVQRHSDVKYISIEEGIKKADVIVCCMNLTEQNRNYFDYELLRRSKKGLVFVNIARGELSPSEDLLKLIDEGHLEGVALDVYNREAEVGSGLRTKNIGGSEEIKTLLKLQKRRNVILTPHNAFNTFEAVERKSSQSVQQIAYFLKNRRFLWEVPQKSKKSEIF